MLSSPLLSLGPPVLVTGVVLSQVLFGYPEETLAATELHITRKPSCPIVKLFSHIAVEFVKTALINYERTMIQ
jgi:hypothetical protein